LLGTRSYRSLPSAAARLCWGSRCDCRSEISVNAANSPIWPQPSVPTPSAFTHRPIQRHVDRWAERAATREIGRDLLAEAIIPVNLRRQSIALVLPLVPNEGGWHLGGEAQSRCGPMDMEPAMPRSRGVARDFTIPSFPSREHSRTGDGRLSAKSAFFVIGGVSIFLWALIAEMIVSLAP